MKLSRITSGLLFSVLFVVSPIVCQNSKPKSTNAKADPEWSLRAKLIVNPRDREAHEQLCQLLEKRDKFREAANERRAWLDDNPGDVSDLISLITTSQIRLFDPEYALVSAQQFLSRLKADDLYYGWANDEVGRLLIDRERFSDATPYLENATRAAPGIPDYWSHLCSALMGTKQYDKAIVAIEKALDLDPSSFSAHYKLGDALAGKGDLV
jgi:tetratricopeptide (TPR) repeat protein